MTRLQEHIVPFMEERGFRFSESRVHFTRKVGQVCQNIALCSDRYNTADNCTFWTMWSANAPEYLSGIGSSGVTRSRLETRSEILPTGTSLDGRAGPQVRGTPSPTRPRTPPYRHRSEAISRTRDCLGWSAFQLGKARLSTFGSSAGGTTRLRISSSSPDAWRKHTL